MNGLIVRRTMIPFLSKAQRYEKIGGAKNSKCSGRETAIQQQRRVLLFLNATFLECYLTPTIGICCGCKLSDHAEEIDIYSNPNDGKRGSIPVDSFQPPVQSPSGTLSVVMYERSCLTISCLSSSEPI